MKLKLIIPLFVITLLTACKSGVVVDGKKYDCVGLNQEKDSTLVYKYSTRNIVVGAIFIEIIAPPVIVVLNELQCPVKVKTHV